MVSRRTFFLDVFSPVFKICLWQYRQYIKLAICQDHDALIDRIAFGVFHRKSYAHNI
jgi:hypothetical protein